MQQKLIQSIFLGFLTLTLILSSCNRPEYEIFTVVPDNAAVVGSFSPGKLMKKSQAKDLEFIKKALEDKEFNKILFENPGISGIDINANSCIFLSGSEQKYLGVVMPLKSRKVFEIFLDKLGEEYKAEFKKEKGENFTYSKKGNNILAWNNSLLIHLTQIKGLEVSPVENKLTELFSLKDENCILSEKDFKAFLSEQKDLNIWITSNQIGSLSDSNLGMINMLGAVNNNYAHIFLEFQDGAVMLSSNLRLNPDFEKNFDKFNIINLDAEKEILKMLPADDLILAGNFRINPDKILEIIKSFGLGNQTFLQEFEKETGKTPEHFLKSIEGSLAFTINGISPVALKSIDSACGIPGSKKIPVIVAVLKLNDDQVFSDLIKIAQKKEPFVEKNGYYIIQAENVPFYLGVKNKLILLSNEEKYISGIFTTGEVKNNLLSLDISKSLIDNPICFYLNLDRDSYSDKVKDYLNEEMDKSFARDMKGFGASFKSLTLCGNIEKSELRIELKDKSVNSLYAILKSMDH
jgi:hypothetical protein